MNCVGCVGRVVRQDCSDVVSNVLDDLFVVRGACVGDLVGAVVPNVVVEEAVAGRDGVAAKSILPSSRMAKPRCFESPKMPGGPLKPPVYFWIGFSVLDSVAGSLAGLCDVVSIGLPALNSVEGARVGLGGGGESNSLSTWYVLDPAPANSSVGFSVLGADEAGCVGVPVKSMLPSSRTAKPRLFESPRIPGAPLNPPVYF